jgi:recombination protein RecT
MSNEIQKITIKDYMSAPAVQKKMQEMMVSPDMIRQFTTSVISLSSSDELLATAEPRSLFNAALTAASMNLPINKNLGFAHIIGYKNNKEGGRVEAQFQMGARGFKELAQRSNRYLIINEGVVKDGEVKSRNRLTGEVEWNWEDDDEKRNQLATIGYFSYFKLDNGFESTLYWTVEEVKAHAKQFSKSYQKGFGPWKDMFDAMAKKTVMKLNISKNGPLDINLQQAVTVDQAVIKDSGDVEYIDGEVVEQEVDLPENAIEEIKKAKSTEELSSIVDELTVAQRKAAVPYVNERMSKLTAKPAAKK